MSPDPEATTPRATIQRNVQRRLDDLIEQKLAESQRRPGAARARPASARQARAPHDRPPARGAGRSPTSPRAAGRAPAASSSRACPPPPAGPAAESRAIPWDHWATSPKFAAPAPSLNMSACTMADDMTGRRAPGPAAYSWDTDLIRNKAPVQSIHAKLPDESDYMSKRSPGPCKYSCSTDVFKSKAPVQSIHAKLPDESYYMSQRSPGPANYSYDTDAFKTRAPVQTIHSKLPDESFYMAKRSPGPGFYKGAASCAKKQSCVDSTKKRSTSCSFRGPERFGGTQYELWVNGALNRYG